MLSIGQLIEAPVNGQVVQGRIEIVSKEFCTIRLIDAPCNRIQLNPDTQLKLVYGPGEFKCNGNDANELTGATIEVQVDTGEIMQGVIKQYDPSLNCFLIRYENDQKEWIDLTRRRVKVCVKVHTEFPCASLNQVPILDNLPSTIPDTSINSPWYFDGSQIELFDENHVFQEGAVVCNRTQAARLCLFSTTKGMFDIDVTTYPHKVVLHGLSKVQIIPSGYCIEVYNTLRGTFRSGHILKKAELAKLVPVRFDTASLEWIDLSTQTFKLVLFPNQPRISAREYATRSLSFPRLAIGTIVEVHDGKGYRKHSIVHLTSTKHVYEIRDLDTQVRSIVDIATARCKVCLKDAKDFDLETSRLLNQVIEVYLKAHKRVDVGRICGGNNKTRMLHVQFEAGRREWYHMATTKMKIRFSGQQVASPSLFIPTGSNQAHAEPKQKLERAHSLQNVLESPPRPTLRRASSTNLMLQRTPLAQVYCQPLQPKRLLQRADSFNSMDGCSVDSARSIESVENNANSEWKMQIDPISHSTYYIHVPTGQSQWHPPRNIDISTLEWLDNNTDVNTYHIDSNISSIHMPVGPIEAVRHSRQNDSSLT